MTTLLYHHHVFEKHATGVSHPERPDRIISVFNALRDLPELQKQTAPRADPKVLELVHPAEFVENIMTLIPQPGQGLVAIDSDTVVSPDSGEAALHAVGAVCSAVDAVIGGRVNNAFCAVRPPGHHAEPDRAMGFCLFNSVAIGAVYARQQHGLERVAVIDFDVHHGNGTQAAFWDRPDCMYMSTHQSPLYPGTGSRAERGAHNNIVNVPLVAGSDGKVLKTAWTEALEPALREFKPDMILLSAGFDAHTQDPLASLNFVEADYAWLTREIMLVAADCCSGRVVSALEGGYDLDALAASATAHVQALQKA